jgi:uncharacterized protein
MAKPTGAICNLDCTYCFYLDKERLYPDSKFRMSDDVLDAYIAQLIEAHRSSCVTIAWQGGEPTLMGIDFFRRAIACIERHRREGMSIEHTIQTNGTLLTDEWCELFREHDFLIGISIDGPAVLHDAYRLDKNGKPTFDRVMRGLRLLQKHGVDYNVLTAVNHMNGDHPLEVYRFLRDDVGTTWIQLIPVVERIPSTSEVSHRSVGAEQLGRFLIAIFDEWVRRDVGRIFVQTFEAAARSWVGLPSGMCVFDATCGNALALEHSGDVYSCDHFVEPKHLLGNIKKSKLLKLVTSEQQRQFGRAKLDTLPRFCRECDVRFACHGECPKNRFIKAPDGEPGLNYLCAGYRMFFRHVDPKMRTIASLIRRGLPAPLVMSIEETKSYG